MTPHHRSRRGPVLTTVLALLLGTSLALAFAWAQGADLPLWPRAHRPAAGTDADAAAALAEVCTTPQELPRRAAVARQPRRDPFKY